MNKTILMVGLGNPGHEYEKNRHNIGFVVADKAISNFHPPAGGPISKLNNKLKAEITTGLWRGRKIIIAKPQTFMNRSGESVALAARFYKIKPENIWVIHDDLDLPLGKIKIQNDRSAAGHKGVQSIIECLGTRDFVRFRLGIGRPTGKKTVEQYVLEPFGKTEQKTLSDVLEKTIIALKDKI